MVAERVAPIIAGSDIASLDAAFAAQRAAHARAPYPPREVRADRLDRLEQALRRHDVAIREAISADFGHRSHEETLLFEQFLCAEGIRHARRHLRAWMRPERHSVAWWSLPGRASVVYQPLGVVGIIVPWNYPLYLSFLQLAGAFAAGNRAMVKMSENSVAVTRLLRELCPRYFQADKLAWFEETGGVGIEFSSLPFDHLFFTGSTRVGKDVMRAAAENLTPVTLELGGKSPAIVTDEFDLAESARRIMFSKLGNAGQTCVAADYALVPAARLEDFLAACREAAMSFYPTLVENPQYTSIVNERQFARLQSYVEDARQLGATVHPLHAQPTEPQRRRFSPVALTGVTDAMRVMQEEIFGPLLPVVPYGTLDEAIGYINARPRPLALYYFGGSAGRERVLRETISGGVTVNNTLFHVAQEGLPFGGVGPSGMGDYHGFAGFRCFSKAKPVYHDGRLSGSVLLRPPYGRVFQAMLKLLYR